VFDFSTVDFTKWLREEKKKALFDVNSPPGNGPIKPLPRFVTVEKLESILFGEDGETTWKNERQQITCSSKLSKELRSTWQMILALSIAKPVGAPTTLPISWDEFQPLRKLQLDIIEKCENGESFEWVINIFSDSQSNGGYVVTRVNPVIVLLYSPADCALISRPLH